MSFTENVRPTNPLSTELIQSHQSIRLYECSSSDPLPIRSVKLATPITIVNNLDHPPDPLQPMMLEDPDKDLGVHIFNVTEKQLSSIVQIDLLPTTHNMYFKLFVAYEYKPNNQKYDWVGWVPEGKEDTVQQRDASDTQPYSVILPRQVVNNAGTFYAAVHVHSKW